MLSPAVFDCLQQRLSSAQASRHCEARRLLQYCAGHLWVWSWRDHRLLVAGTGDTASVQTVQLEAGPDHEVTGLAVSRLEL